MRSYKKMYNDAMSLARDSIAEAKGWRRIALENMRDIKKIHKRERENLRLLDSYMQTNSRQAQDIIELESVAIALYDVLWHLVCSVEDELKDSGVTNLNSYKTIVALFEAEEEDE